MQLPNAGTSFAFGAQQPFAQRQPQLVPQQTFVQQPQIPRSSISPPAPVGPYQMGQTAPSKPQGNFQDVQGQPVNQSNGIHPKTNGDLMSHARATSNYIPQTSTPQSAGPTQLVPQGTQNWGNMQLPLTNGNGANGKVDKTKELEKRVAELEHLLRQKNGIIQNLQAELKKAGTSAKVISQKSSLARDSQNSPDGRGYGPSSRGPSMGVSELKPVVPYVAQIKTDPIDVRLEEFYNSTNSAIPFSRINKGWYKFGKTQVELDIINHKLMAKTDEGWNRGKYGDVEKFVVTFEPIERERAGVPFD